MRILNIRISSFLNILDFVWIQYLSKESSDLPWKEPHVQVETELWNYIDMIFFETTESIFLPTNIKYLNTELKYTM